MRRLIVVGASVRAAAGSAIRAGFEPWCADLFADVDLRRMAKVVRVSRRGFPGTLDAALRSAPDAPLIYTGGLENAARLLARWAGSRLLWGNSGGPLRTVRDPRRLAGLADHWQVMRPQLGPRPLAGRWLAKPRRGSGGQGIRWYDGVPRVREYVQEFIEGPSVSAVFVGADQRCDLIGVTRQLVGEPWLHAGPFNYCGSVGPLQPDPAEQAAWIRVGQALTAGAGLRGVFGVDAVMTPGGPCVIEVNPRYPASAEVLELATGMSVIGRHAQAFGAELTTVAATARAAFVGKAVYFAGWPVRFPMKGPWESKEPSGVTFADLPEPGCPIGRGEPVLTVLTPGENFDQCLAKLRSAAVELDLRMA